MENKKSGNRAKGIVKKIPLIGWMYRQWSFRSNSRRSLAWHHNNRDFKDNNETKLPPNEKVELHCVWITEVFPPSKVNDLISGIQTLGWDQEDRNRGTYNNLVSWIKQSRSHAGGGAWINGGIIQSLNDPPRFMGESKKTWLPEGVDFCRFSLRNITSSITLATIQFVLKDEWAHSLNIPFNKAYKTKVEYCPSWFNCKRIYYIDPRKQKREAIKAQVKLIHENLYEWFKDNLPGYYSANDLMLPTVDLITTTEFDPPKQDRNDHYSDLLFEYNYENWNCKNMPDLQLRLPWEYGVDPNAVLFGKFDKLTTNTEAYGGKNRAAITSKLDSELNRTIGLWTLHDLLLSYERQLLEIRDRALSPIKRVGRALKDLNFIRNQFLAIATDIQSASFDVINLTKHKGRYSHDCADFSPPDFYEGKIPDLLELLREKDEARSETLSNLEAQVNASINADGNLTSAIANLHIQKSIRRLTVFIGLLTFVGSLAALYFSNPLLEELHAKIDYLINLSEENR